MYISSIGNSVSRPSSMNFISDYDYSWGLRCLVGSLLLLLIRRSIFGLHHRHTEHSWGARGAGVDGNGPTARSSARPSGPERKTRSSHLGYCTGMFVESGEGDWGMLNMVDVSTSSPTKRRRIFGRSQQPSPHGIAPGDTGHPTWARGIPRQAGLGAASAVRSTVVARASPQRGP